jgi:hypothetical protein
VSVPQIVELSIAEEARTGDGVGVNHHHGGQRKASREWEGGDARIAPHVDDDASGGA